MCISSSHKPAYVYYRLPDTQEVRHWEGWSRIWDGKWPEEEGFLVVPFHGQGIWLGDSPGESVACGVRSVESSLTDIHSYEEVFPVFHRAIEEGSLRKIVLSYPFESRQLQCEQFQVLCERYPHSMVYLLHSPHTGTWMGATPESLLDGEGPEWHTMALAGTKASPDEPWDEKNLREQEVVGGYIRATLRLHATQIRESERYTMQSGNLYHLRTDFHFHLAHKDAIPQLLHDLHPTPAVCGLPKQEAMNFILAHEGYDRQFYAGFLGPVNSSCGTHLAVNIRCAQLFPDGRSLLYAGSGLMPDSTLEGEWTEVKRKGRSLI